jgi:ribonuclease Y
MSLFSNLSTLFGSDENKRRPKRRQFKPLKPSQDPQIQSQPVKAGGPQDANIQASPIKPGQPGQTVQTQQNTQSLQAAQAKSQQIVSDAQAKAREVLIEAKSEALAIQSKAEQKQKELSDQLEDQQKRLDQKLDRIDERLGQMDNKEAQIAKDRKHLDELQIELTTKRQQVIKELEEVSELTTEEAKEALFSNLEKKLSKEMALMIRQKEEEAEAEAEEKVRDILIDAMKHGATDYVSEYTVSVVKLPSEETKGKIIGKSGRNINAFEHRTGVDVDLDMSPTEVRLSCFNPVRREIARISLERLIKDGRIQPSRIEEVVDKVEKEIDKITFEAGKQLCHELGVFNLPVDLMKMLGKFKYRFSYGQNLIAHTLEETKIGIKIAHELGIDVNTVKLGCLLHDIGKVSDEEEGSHVELGVRIAKRYNIPQAVVDCIAQHHEDEPFTGPEQMAVYIADAISGARPGARYENYEEYVKRLQQLEEIATAYDGVKQAYAIQAGREIRVLLEAEHSKDADVKVLSLKIRDEIREKVTYPGTVTVTVVRELRHQEVAT